MTRGAAEARASLSNALSLLSPKTGTLGSFAVLVEVSAVVLMIIIQQSNLICDRGRGDCGQGVVRTRWGSKVLPRPGFAGFLEIEQDL
jgi:hypothetical protein